MAPATLLPGVTGAYQGGDMLAVPGRLTPYPRIYHYSFRVGLPGGCCSPDCLTPVYTLEGGRVNYCGDIYIF